MKKRVLLLVGPTGVGKTLVALEIAKQFATEIISADSRQVYKFMDIGTAKPSHEQMAAVPHHFIDIKYPDEYYSAGQFGQDARKCVKEIFKRGKQPIVVGGSGLYIRALVDGLFEPKVADDTVKNKLKKEVQERGISELHKRLKSIDPVTADKLNTTDTQRILRALEVYQVSGQPFSAFLAKQPEPADFEPCFIGFTMDRKKLYAKIEARIDAMLKRGFLDEVLDLQNKGYGSHLNSLQTVGYKEAFLYLEKTINYSEMVRLFKQKTRNYAKRQLTWFKKDKRIHWVNLSSFPNQNDLADYIVQIFDKPEILSTKLA
ncbi:MAG: tRNA (adenosine(37)-N6)-dimethylallyltransferase MiaA [bacterium]